MLDIMNLNACGQAAQGGGKSHFMFDPTARNFACIVLNDGQSQCVDNRNDASEFAYNIYSIECIGNRNLISIKTSH